MAEENIHQLEPGSQLYYGAYRIERVLGQGGFGITYLATQVRLNRPVAVKEFFPKAFCKREGDTSQVAVATDANAQLVSRLRSKFIKEAQHISMLDFPYIVRITDVFEENGTAYYVMQYIEGESLAEKVKREGPLSEARAVSYIIKIGKALTYIHSQRMNHLDVKPANIMIRTADDTPILVDFGLSKQYDSDGNQTSTTPVGLSHGFAPMEQYREGGVREFSPQTDLYSLAATLYYLLTGIVPPQAPSLVDEELSFPSTVRPHLINAISKAMSPSRRKRHETIAEFIADLTPSAAGSTAEETVEATVVTPGGSSNGTANSSAKNNKPVPPAPPREFKSFTPDSARRNNLQITVEPPKKRYGCLKAFCIGAGVLFVFAIGFVFWVACSLNDDEEDYVYDDTLEYVDDEVFVEEVGVDSELPYAEVVVDSVEYVEDEY